MSNLYNRNNRLFSFLIFAFCFIVSQTSFAQKKGQEVQNKQQSKKLKIADELFEMHSYYNATGYYKQVLQEAPQNEYALFKLGLTFFKSRDYKNSEIYLRKVYDWKKEKASYPTAIYYYARTLKVNGKYEEAKKSLLNIYENKGKEQ